MKKNLLFLVATTAFFSIQMLLTSSSSGQMGSTSGCGGGSCHGTGGNSQTVITMTFDGAALTTYTPGKNYAVVFTVSNSNSANNAKAGFDLIVSKGAFSNPPASTMNMTTEIHHTAPKTMTAGTTSWAFNWTAPAAGSGTVTFGAAANSVNGTGTNANDAWNTFNLNVNEAVQSTPPTIAAPTSASITTTSATINTSVTPNSNSCTMILEYGLTTSYGTRINMTPATVSGTTVTNVSATLSGLTPNTTYNYRIIAKYGTDSLKTSNATFKTSQVPTASIQTAYSSIQIFPNPSSEFLKVKNMTSRSIRSITAIDISGKKSILSYEMKDNEVMIPINTLTSGTYHLVIEQADQTVIRSKFVKD